jgi:hypothetical protein
MAEAMTPSVKSVAKLAGEVVQADAENAVHLVFDDGTVSGQSTLFGRGQDLGSREEANQNRQDIESAVQLVKGQR